MEDYARQYDKFFHDNDFLILFLLLWNNATTQPFALVSLENL